MLKNKYTLVPFILFFFISSFVKKQNVITNYEINKYSNTEQSFLSFVDTNDFINTCHLVSNTLHNDENFYSMLDVFEELNNQKNPNEYKKFINENKNFLIFNKIKDNNNLIHQTVNLKINFLFASLVNKKGEVKIANKLYNLLTNETMLKELETMLIKEDCHNLDTCDLVSIPEYLMIYFPMFKFVLVPIVYPTNYFKTTINDKEVIIQVWKGYFSGVLGYPGGIGAEVGLYHPVTWTKNLWFPDYKHTENISLKLILKSTNELIFSVSDNTWWLNSWTQNYSGLPLKGSDYILEFSVADSTWLW